MTTPNALRRATFGDFIVDFDSFELRKHGIRLKLQDQPFQILKLLLRRPGELVTREQLRAELWTENTFVDFDAGLNAAIRRLRDALNDSAEEPRYIETLPRHGYRFIAPVEIVAQPAPTPPEEVFIANVSGNGHQEVGVSAEPGGLLATKQTRLFGMSWVRKLAAACALLVAVGVSTVVLRSGVFAKRSVDGRAYSIAVLPLQNLSGDASQDYFADGMTDALITNLAQSNSLQVISRTSSTRYKGTQKPLPEIGHELNVSLVIEGSVIRTGNHVRITAQLLDAAKDRLLWAGRYDRDLNDVFQLQSELASAVTLEVVGRLTPDEGSSMVAQVRPVNPESYEAYLKGKYFLDKWTGEGFEKAKGYFQQSIDLDPSYADGYAGLSEYYATVAFLGIVPPRDSWLKAEGLITKALEIDHSSSSDHAQLGMIKLQFGCDRAAAETELSHALRLNPGNMSALDFHSYYLLEVGRTDEAIAEKRRVLEHDPLSVKTSAELGLYLFLAGHTDEAIAQLQKALDLDPNYAAAHMRLGWAYTRKQQYDRAVAEIRKAIVLDKKPMRLANLGEVYALWGKRQEAMRTISALREMSKQRYVAPTTIALVYARLGEKKAAISWLEKAKPEDDPKVSDPGFESLRSDPRFKMLETRLKAGPSCPAF
jgi:TolB-like protein/DNA-binding winged helix-turn-helix (wHTH) protein/Flp pilus assembly protein TadD